MGCRASATATAPAFVSAIADETPGYTSAKRGHCKRAMPRVAGRKHQVSGLQT